MDLLPNEEQQEIIEQTAAFLATELPRARLRALSGPGERVPDATWKSIAELGWFGLGLTEEQGGVGFTLAEEALLLREVGRQLGPPALLATLLGARCAAVAGLDSVRDEIVGGGAVVAFAEAVEPPVLGESVSGRFQVFDAESARYLLVVGDAGAALLDALVAREGRRADCIDDTLSLTEITLREEPVVTFVPTANDPIRTRAVVLTAAVLVGVAEAARDDAVGYAKERFQFGKPIGVFQAVKHPCADMAVACEAAWSQTTLAAIALRDGLPDAAFQAAAAKAVAARAAIRGAEADVQIHGGYGFTVEYDPHLFVKRAHVLDRLAGDSPRQLADVLAGAPPR